MTGREIVVLQRLAAGRTQNSIARELDVTARTINRIIHQLRLRFSANSTSEMIAVASRQISLRPPQNREINA